MLEGSPRALSLIATMLLAFAGIGAATAPAVAANQSQNGLVNVQIGDITTGDILSNDNVNVAVAANVAAAVCGVTAPVAVLAQQVFRTLAASAVTERRSS
jgi:hypothetical protein